MGKCCNVVILGASYGSLLGIKLAMAGHSVTLVCLPEEAELINSEGAIVRFLSGDETVWSKSVRGNSRARYQPADRKMSARGTSISSCLQCRNPIRT